MEIYLLSGWKPCLTARSEKRYAQLLRIVITRYGELRLEIQFKCRTNY
jgi:hypothetical protein